MAVQQRILQQGNDLNTLKELLELIKNPQSIVDAHATYRKEIALTEAEQTKADEARAFIAKYAVLFAEYQKQCEELKNDKAEFEKTKTEFSAFCESARIQAEEILSQANQQKNVLAAKEADINSREIKLKDSELKFNNKMAAVQKDIDDKIKYVADRDKEHANEYQKLAALKTELDIRAKKITLREQAIEL